MTRRLRTPGDISASASTNACAREADRLNRHGLSNAAALAPGSWQRELASPKRPAGLCDQSCHATAQHQERCASTCAYEREEQNLGKVLAVSATLAMSKRTWSMPFSSSDKTPAAKAQCRRLATWWRKSCLILNVHDQWLTKMAGTISNPSSSLIGTPTGTLILLLGCAVAGLFAPRATTALGTLSVFLAHQSCLLPVLAARSPWHTPARRR